MNIAQIYRLDATSNPLLSAFFSHCARAPQDVAIRCGGEDVSYAGLYATVAAFSAGLRSRGVSRGDIVAVGVDRDAQSIALLLAIIANGAAYLPIVARRADLRLVDVIEQTQPHLLIGDAALRRSLPVKGQWIERGALVSAATDVEVVESGTLAYVLLGTGASGHGGGVAMRTRAASALIDWHRGHARLGKAVRTLQFAALDNEIAFQEIFSTLASGGMLVLAGDGERRDLSALLELLRRERIERAFLPNPILEMLAAVAARRDEALPTSLLDVVTCGRQLQFTPELRALFAALRDCVLHIHFGPTRTEAVAAEELSAVSYNWPRAGAFAHMRLRDFVAHDSGGMRQRAQSAARTLALVRAAAAERERMALQQARAHTA